MVDWLGAAYAIHVLLAVLGAIGLFRYWGRTHFWLPRYVHFLAAIGLAVGLACIAFMPPSAPSIRVDGLGSRGRCWSSPSQRLSMSSSCSMAASVQRMNARIDPYPANIAGTLMSRQGSQCPHCGQTAA